MKDRSRYSMTLSFLDMLFTLLLGVVLMLALSMLLINPPKKTDIPTPKRTAEYLVRVFWQHDSPTDVDLWVKEPSGAIVYYANKEGQVTHLERDDLGQTNDMDTEGKPIIWNEEDTVIRGLIEGVWEVSVHNYSQKGGPDPIVKWELIRVKDASVLATGEVKLSDAVREQGCVQFYMEKGGPVRDIKTNTSVLIATQRARAVGGAPNAGGEGGP